MKQKRKRTWTVVSALEWIGRVEDGKEKRGLKYCSAASFLRKYAEKAVIKRA